MIHIAQGSQTMDSHMASCAVTQQAGLQSVRPYALRETCTRPFRPSLVKPFVHARSPLLQRHANRHRLTTRALFSFGRASTQTGLSDNCWEQAKQKPKYAPLNKDIEVDVCVVGAGIVGLTTAYNLAQAG